MQVEVLNIKGEKTGRTIELPDDVFGIEPNDHVIYLAVKQYQAAQRQGTHKVKTRAEAKGSSRNCIVKKVQVVQEKVISVIHYIKVVVRYLVLNPTDMISN